MAEDPMRVADLAQQIADRAARRHFEKRAGLGVGALSVGLQVPGAVAHGVRKGHQVTRDLDVALEQKLAAPGQPQTFGSLVGHSMLKTVGSALGTMGADLLKDMAVKAYAMVRHPGAVAAQDAILQQIKTQDPVLAQADDKVLMEAYHTMTRFAPTLATDKNAVRNFLRQSVMSGNGPDFIAIKLLADTERAITGGTAGHGH